MWPFLYIFRNALRKFIVILDLKYANIVLIRTIFNWSRYCTRLLYNLIWLNPSLFILFSPNFINTLPICRSLVDLISKLILILPNIYLILINTYLLFLVSNLIILLTIIAVIWLLIFDRECTSTAFLLLLIFRLLVMPIFYIGFDVTDVRLLNVCLNKLLLDYFSILDSFRNIMTEFRLFWLFFIFNLSNTFLQ